MANVIFAWQLGHGLGHMMQMLPLASALSKQGHRVYMVLRNLRMAANIYRGTGVHFLQAPAKTDGIVPFPKPVSFAHLLANTGFGRDLELYALTCAWRNLFRLIRPNLIVFDHSPVALLAARGFPARRALIGTGFWCPPDICPLPCMRSARKRAIDPVQIAQDEQTILHRANWVLSHWKQSPMERLGQLYGEVEERFLTTFKEFDPFPDRPSARYWGPINAVGGKPPQWPESTNRKRIYAYLKPFAGLEDLLEALRQLSHSTLIYYDGIGARTRERFASDTIRFTSEPVDPAVAARECDISILNGTPGATCDMLLAGKPVLQIPLYADQEYISEQIAAAGAGIVLPPKRSNSSALREAITDLLECGQYHKGAQDFAAAHSDFNRDYQRSDMLQRANELLKREDRKAGVTQNSTDLTLPPKNNGDATWTLG